MCMYAVKHGIQSGCWISVVAGMRHWKLAVSFPPTLCNQARRLFVQHAIKQVLRLIGCRRCHLSVRYEERLVDISFDSTQRGEEEGIREV